FHTLFFFSCYVDHRHLHSFPTRRSSDLDAVAKSPPDGYTILQNTNGQAISPSLYKSLPFDAVKDFVPVTQLVASNGTKSLTASKDRKSTRLNSSHVAISYAVFCLKKKKK